MSRRVAHMVKLTFQTDEPQGTCTPYIDFYWCGKNYKYLKDTSPLSPKEQNDFDKFKAKQEINPWPECMKCRKAKYKVKS